MLVSPVNRLTNLPSGSQEVIRMSLRFPTLGGTTVALNPRIRNKIKPKAEVQIVCVWPGGGRARWILPLQVQYLAIPLVDEPLPRSVFFSQKAYLAAGNSMFWPLVLVPMLHLLDRVAVEFAVALVVDSPTNERVIGRRYRRRY